MSSAEAQTPGSTCAPGTFEEELQRIEREQSEVVDLEQKQRDLEDLHRRARELSGEIHAARTSRRRRSAESALPVIHPREPCTAAWDDMSGDERVRACGRCKARVYDLGGLDPSEARRLLSESEGRIPTHVVGRVDGTVTTESCSEKRTRMSPLAIGLAASGAAGLLLSGVALGYFLNGPPEMVEVEGASPANMEALIDDAVEARMADALEKSEAAATPPPPPTPPVTPEPPVVQERNERRKRRSRCRRHRGYSSWGVPLFFWESSDTSGLDLGCEDE